jgi:6-phosphogluconolactonase (cycloisomerase 2 family)
MLVRTFTLVLALLSAQVLLAQNGFVYTNDESFFAPNTVSLMSIQGDGSLVKVGSFHTGGLGNAGNGFDAVRRIIVSPDNRFVFAANARSNDVSVFTIDSASGSLTLVPGSPFSTGGNGCDGIGLAATPDTKFLYASNTCSDNISIFKIGGDGSLQLVGSPVSTTDLPVDMKVTSNGSFLMTSLFSFSGGMIAVFAIGSDGSLTPVNGSPFSDGNPPGGFTTSMDTNCASNLLFVDNASGLPVIDDFNIDSTGALAQIANSPFTAPGNGVTAITLSPDEKFLYASNQQNSVTSFSVGPDGSLSVVAGTPVASTGTPFLNGLATDATGSFLYVAGFINNVAAYTVGSQGGLTLHAGSPFHTSGIGGFESLATFPSKSCAITVNIAVKPGDTDPAINSKSNGKIPVAILATSTFDPLTQVDTTSLKFGHSGTENSLAFCNANGEDVNGDGLPDLVCHFNTPACDFQVGDTQANLTGKTLGGTAIKGTAAITVNH